ncbi:hypothetical protein I633_08410 [Alteromonas mediterranea 615]|uniref:PEP-CTERM protein-sorting domain-containing protein n=1 Tax=Alteromonas mediterranea 615 TaxID=1300253 RepID=S5AEF4_9ALTE|nr:hypothetical protein I633_08410 [Alteromonas mediterranea 615]
MKKFVAVLLSLYAFTANAAIIELDFSGPFTNYSNQFLKGTVEAQNDGKTLNMFGNNWVAFEGVYNINVDTILMVTFSSSQLGELHGFGFDNDTVFDNQKDYIEGANRYFQFAGSQTFGVQDYNTYKVAGNTETFIVEVGKFLTGTFSQLVFINDLDNSSANAQSSFNIATTDTSFAEVSEPGVFSLMLMAFALVFGSRSTKLR